MKKNIVTIAFDDAPHSKMDLAHNRILNPNLTVNPTKVPLVGVTCRGLQLLHTTRSQITVDGTDATEKILEVIQQNPYLNEIQLIFIDSPTMGGFNLPNAFTIYEQTHIPVILLPDRRPKSKIGEVFQEVFPSKADQIAYLEQLPGLESLKVEINHNPGISRIIYFHAIGIEKHQLIPLFHHLSEFSAIPEPLRLAHIIASESRIEFGE
ncbi:hypothetical protein NEF87_001954 [Candidatus Lokiarchaeum ossiferum]|uniref:UPF0215 protein NEF87_001954 n=1 Tax=Candidatus Lokiarchaeum ossiferum TaxID=2951803 RepID=A0ABY6HQ82_9ARCH|nr:hypothetical protein NEF87_001954 [Candidatus Lokiarchaeum sp. B-35]